jgi:hypothetical protein
MVLVSRLLKSRPTSGLTTSAVSQSEWVFAAYTRGSETPHEAGSSLHRRSSQLALTIPYLHQGIHCLKEVVRSPNDRDVFTVRKSFHTCSMWQDAGPTHTHTAA